MSNKLNATVFCYLTGINMLRISSIHNSAGTTSGPLFFSKLTPLRKVPPFLIFTFRKVACVGSNSIESVNAILPVSGQSCFKAFSAI